MCIGTAYICWIGFTIVQTRSNIISTSVGNIKASSYSINNGFDVILSAELEVVYLISHSRDSLFGPGGRSRPDRYVS